MGLLVFPVAVGEAMDSLRGRVIPALVPHILLVIVVARIVGEWPRIRVSLATTTAVAPDIGEGPRATERRLEDIRLVLVASHILFLLPSDLSAFECGHSTTGYGIIIANPFGKNLPEICQNLPNQWLGG